MIYHRFSIVAVNEAGAGPPAEANITTPESKGTGAAESLSLSVSGDKITFTGLLCTLQKRTIFRLQTEHNKKLYTKELIAHQRQSCSLAVALLGYTAQ